MILNSNLCLGAESFPSATLIRMGLSDVLCIWGTSFLVVFTMQPFQNYLSAYILDELHHFFGLREDKHRGLPRLL